jgi:hypothetical protein
MQRKGLFCATVLALGAAGCAPNYIYRPSQNATANVRGRLAADYNVPQGKPRGNVRVASFGVSKVTPVGTTGPQSRVLHARLVVANNSDRPWSLDVTQQVAEVHGGPGPVHPAFARSDAGSLPIVRIDPGGKRTIDLFFPLPLGAERASKVPEFDVVWRLDTAPQVVLQRTPFERLAVEPLWAGPGWGWYWGPGPYGWYDPLWGPAYIGAPGWYW